MIICSAEQTFHSWFSATLPCFGVDWISYLDVIQSLSLSGVEDCKIDFPRFLLGDDRGEMMLCFSLTSTAVISLCLARPASGELLGR